jgi:hypothetical protein
LKLLTATTQTQGQRDNDFAWCIPGEVVSPFTFICDRDRELGPDGGCGCGRAFTGLNSSKATTTAIVTDIDGYSLEDLVTAVLATRQQEGWADGDDDPDRSARQLAMAIAETAAEFEVGDVLEIRLGEIGRRRA